MSTVPQRTPEQAAALAAVFALLDEDARDQQTRWDHWPQNDAPASLAALDRMRARGAPGGPMDQALDIVDAAYGGRRPVAVDEEILAAIRRHAYGGKGGWIIQQAEEGTGPLADACRGLLRAGRERPDGR
jgi:hypothetical protein